MLVLVLQSCEKETPEVSFRIKIEGFTLKEDPNSHEMEHPTLVHSYSAGRISFTRGQQSHSFYLGEGKMEDYLFMLPPGEYILKMDIPQASLYGQATGSFLVEPDTLIITEMTDTLTIPVKANCALILVSDELEQLHEGPFFIERHSYAGGPFKSYLMARDSTSGLYYAYFTPDPKPADPSAFLWFYGERPGVEEGGMPTTLFEAGYQYFLTILE